eukprot:2387859-Pleurochrysis_carterae.AAC.9
MERATLKEGTERELHAVAPFLQLCWESRQKQGAASLRSSQISSKNTKRCAFLPRPVQSHRIPTILLRSKRRSTVLTPV